MMKDLSELVEECIARDYTASSLLKALDAAGFRVVPIEPTLEMILKADESGAMKPCEATPDRHRLLRDVFWPAFLAAAPKVTP